MRGSIRAFTGTCATAAIVALAGCAETMPLTAPDDAVVIRTLPRAPAGPASNHDQVYEVRIDNLTTSQPLSPGVLATHDETVTLFEAGAFASEGIRLIAEEGNPSVAVEELEGQPGVYEVLATTVPIHIDAPGAAGPSSLTVEIRAGEGADYLSLATMLICTNDGFTGGNALLLPQGDQPVTYFGAAYTSGTELNNELSPYLSNSCGAIGPPVGGRLPMDGNGRIPTMEPIAPHPGIHGMGDLVLSRHSWRGPIVRIIITRVP